VRDGIKGQATDAWNRNAPFSFTLRRFAESGDAHIIWEGHKAWREIGNGQMEKLANLDQLPVGGFRISYFPYKAENDSAGFIRAAFFEQWTRLVSNDCFCASRP